MSRQASSFQAFADHRLTADLLWRDVRIPRFSHPTPALFLDRDGVIIEEKEYLGDPDGVELLGGISELIRAARAEGMAVVEITNQAGIARGHFGWSDFVQVQYRMEQFLAQEGLKIDAVFACPFHPEGQPPYQESDHPWRKPNAGMLLEAERLLNLALNRSVLVGDKVADMQAGRAAGLAFGIHVLTGHGRQHEPASRAVASVAFPVHVVMNAGEAAAFIASSQ
jgi:D-glycero-D-manno-heptose 1,7-bisphosphate phosphatase